MTKKLSFVFLLSMALLFTGTASAQNKSIRERLVAAKTVKTVYAIDGEHTLIEGETAFLSGDFTKEFNEEITGLCTEYGGKIEIGTLKGDPITGKKDVQWVPVEQSSVRRDSYLGHMRVEYIRCGGVFDVEARYGVQIKRAFSYKKILIRHATSQPTVYKAEGVPSFDKVTTLPDGEITLSTGKKGGMLGLSTQTLSGADLFQYLQVLCEKEKGKPRYVINMGKEVESPRGDLTDITTGKRFYYADELAEVNAISAFKYAGYYTKPPMTVKRIWYFACEGEQRFVVKGEAEQNFFASNRGLEGVEFKPLSSQPKAEPQGGQPQSIEEEIAVEVATKKTNVFKMVSTQEYTGIYNGQQDGCDLVTVRKNWDTTMKNPRVDTLNYRICGKSIAKVSESPVEKLPDGIDTFSQKLATVAQKLGIAEADYQGYTVKARALRDKDQCAVEVKVFKDINLLSSKVVNGCQ